MAARQRYIIATVCAVVGLVAAIGAPVKFESLSFLRPTATEFQPQPHINSDGSASVVLEGLHPGEVPLFNQHTMVNLYQADRSIATAVDFGGLEALGIDNPMFRGQTWTPSNSGGQQFKVLITTKTPDTVAALIDYRSLYVPTKPIKIVALRQSSLSDFAPLITDFLPFMTGQNCFSALQRGDFLTTRCPEFVYQAPYKLDYNPSSRALTVTPTHHQMWDSLKVYEQGVIFTYGKDPFGKYLPGGALPKTRLVANLRRAVNNLGQFVMQAGSTDAENSSETSEVSTNLSTSSSSAESDSHTLYYLHRTCVGHEGLSEAHDDCSSVRSDKPRPSTCSSDEECTDTAIPTARPTLLPTLRPEEHRNKKYEYTACSWQDGNTQCLRSFTDDPDLKDECSTDSDCIRHYDSQSGDQTSSSSSLGPASPGTSESSTSQASSANQAEPINTSSSKSSDATKSEPSTSNDLTSPIIFFQERCGATNSLMVRYDGPALKEGVGMSCQPKRNGLQTEDHYQQLMRVHEADLRDAKVRCAQIVSRSNKNHPTVAGFIGKCPHACPENTAGCANENGDGWYTLGYTTTDFAVRPVKVAEDDQSICYDLYCQSASPTSGQSLKADYAWKCTGCESIELANLSTSQSTETSTSSTSSPSSDYAASSESSASTALLPGTAQLSLLKLHTK